MNTTEEYLGSETSNANGHALSPSQKAWQTAKDRAVAEAQSRQAENSARFYAEKDAVIRALTDTELSNGAARLFCLLAHCGWKKEFGGMFKDRVGSVYIDGRRLAALCGGASVNCFYAKRRKAKVSKKTKKVLRPASMTRGWIEELLQGGYIWVSKNRIPNIQPERWPNVYNLVCHVPQRFTPALPWQDGSFGSENVVVEGCSRIENSILDGVNTPGDGEKAENTMDRHRNGQQTVTGSGDGPSPDRPMDHHRIGGRPVTGSANGPSPDRGTGHHRIGGRAVTESANGPAVNPVQLRETVEGSTALKTDQCVAEKPKHTPFPKFEALDRKTVIRLRPKIAEGMIDRCKEKIFAVENSRTPIPNGAEVIKAYRTRMKEVKAWAAGEL